MARFYRGRALSQRRDPTEPNRGDTAKEGLDHENHNCSATGAGKAVDSATDGAKRPRGGDMRHSLPRPNTGENPGVELSLGDAKKACGKFGVTLTVAGATGASPTTWAAMKQRRQERRLLLVQGDSGELDRGCSEGQDTGHLIVVHPDDPPPEKSGQWLVMDPWCYLPGSRGLGKWRWLDRDDIFDFAQKLGFRFAYTRRLTRIA